MGPAESNAVRKPECRTSPRRLPLTPDGHSAYDAHWKATYEPLFQGSCVRSTRRFLQRGSHAVRRLVVALLVVVGCLLLASGIVLVVLYRAAQAEPEFYREVLAVDRAALVEAADQMLQRTTALASDLKRSGTWETAFSQQQINGWLAVDLPKNHPNLLPPEVRDPRVDIDDGRLRIACRINSGRWRGVMWLEVEPALPEPNLLALRIRRVRLGTVPVPMGWVLDEVPRAASRFNLRIRWRQLEGDPVLLISLQGALRVEGKQVIVQTVQLQADHLYVAGITE